MAFVTGEEWRTLNADDGVAAVALERRGVRVEVVVWNDPAVDWHTYDTVVLRSCWDYWRDPSAFTAWIHQRAASGVALWNPPETVLWNMDKTYLSELAERGVPIIPSEFPERGTDLGRLLAMRGWETAVLKPRVSADGHRTIKVRALGAEAHQSSLDELTASGGALVQPYMEEVARTGEFSFVFIAGNYSHAALKLPAPSDFRVQPRLGGATRPMQPSPEIIAQAGRVMAAVDRPWLYARVDGCVRDETLLLMELELIEPTLFFEHCPDAAHRFAADLLRRHQP